VSEFFWPSREQVIAVHDASLARFGGASGIRDPGMLDSALARPFASFDGVDAFPDDISRACAMAHAIISDHPFVDGNKRTGAAVLGMVLRSNGMRFKPRHAEFCEVMLGVATGKVSLDKLARRVRSQVA
jgi:death-on-curing protein